VALAVWGNFFVFGRVLSYSKILQKKEIIIHPAVYQIEFGTPFLCDLRRKQKR